MYRKLGHFFCLCLETSKLVAATVQALCDPPNATPCAANQVLFTSPRDSKHGNQGKLSTNSDLAACSGVVFPCGHVLE